MNFAKALAAITGSLQAIELISTWIETRRQNGEMTPDEVAVWEAHLKARYAMPHWNRPENQTGGIPENPGPDTHDPNAPDSPSS